MKARFSALIFVLGLSGVAFAQDPAATVSATPSPEVASPAAPPRAPDRTVYAPRLPSPTELTKIATAQGQTIERIEQSNAQILVTTHTADGHMITVAYRLLASAGDWPTSEVVAAAAPAQPAPQSSVVVHSSPQVVYVSSAPYYYPSYYGYPYYGYYGSPVSVSVGFGWGWGGYYGGYHGGYYCAPYHGHGGYYGGGHHH